MRENILCKKNNPGTIIVSGFSINNRKLLCKISFKSSKLIKKFLGHCVADFSVECLNGIEVFNPASLVNAEKFLHYFGSNVKTFNVDVFRLGKITDFTFNSINLAFASSEDPEKNSEVVTEAGPDKFAFSVCSEPVNVENLGSVFSL